MSPSEIECVSESKWGQVRSREITWVQVSPIGIKRVQVSPRKRESKMNLNEWFQSTKVSHREIKLPKWDQVNVSESKWDQVSASESKCVQVRSREFEWSPLGPSESKEDQVGPCEFKWDHHPFPNPPILLEPALPVYIYIHDVRRRSENSSAQVHRYVFG